MYSKHAASENNPILLSGWQQLIGGLILYLTGMLAGGKITAVSLNGIIVLMALVVSSIIAYTLWLCLSKKYGVSELALIKLSIPIFGIITSAALLGERLFTWQNWAAVLLVSLGVIIAENKGCGK